MRTVEAGRELRDFVGLAIAIGIPQARDDARPLLHQIDISIRRDGERARVFQMRREFGDREPFGDFRARARWRMREHGVDIRRQRGAGRGQIGE